MCRKKLVRAPKRLPSYERERDDITEALWKAAATKLRVQQLLMSSCLENTGAAAHSELKSPGKHSEHPAMTSEMGPGNEYKVLK
jgi:hypothetical protein